MKACLLVFAVVMAMAACTVAQDDDTLVEAFEHNEGPILERFRRETCNSIEETKACDRFCRRLGLPGGACLRNKCDCDRF